MVEQTVHYNISSRGGQGLIFYLGPPAEKIVPQFHRSSSKINNGDGVLFIPVCTKPISSDCRNQSRLKFQLCLRSEFV